MALESPQIRYTRDLKLEVHQETQSQGLHVCLYKRTVGDSGPHSTSKATLAQRGILGTTNPPLLESMYDGVHSPSRGFTIQIMIRHQEICFLMEICKTITVRELKSMVQERIGIRSITISKGGRIMKDYCMIKDYNIKELEVINTQSKMYGGMQKINEWEIREEVVRARFDKNRNRRTAPPEETKVTFNKLRIATQNVAGMTTQEVKMDMIMNSMMNKAIKVMIITETKSWTSEQTKRLNDLQYFVYSAQSEESKRSGVVVITKQEAVQTRRIDQVGSQMVAVQIKFNKNKHQKQKLIVCGLYFNPNPTPNEKKEQDVIMKKLEDLYNNTVIPILAIGDFNEIGKKKMKFLQQKQQWIQQVCRPTRVRQNRDLVTIGELDEIYTRGVQNMEVKIHNLHISDHLLVTADIDAIIIEKAEEFYSKEQLNKAMIEPDINKELIRTNFPMESARRVIMKYVQPQKRTKVPMYKKINFDLPIHEVQEQLAEYNQEIHQEFEAQMEEAEQFNNPQVVFDAVRRVQRSLGGDTTMVRYMKDANGNIMSRTKSIAKITEDMAKKFNELTQRPVKVINTASEDIDIQWDKLVDEPDRPHCDDSNLFQAMRHEVYHDKYKSKVYSDIRPYLQRTLKLFSLKKAGGNDLVTMAFRNAKPIKMQTCKCQWSNNIRTQQQEMTLEMGNLKAHQVVWIECSCERREGPLIDMSFKHVIIDRLALIVATQSFPSYFGNCKLVMLSKIKNPTISSIKDIRPIGLLSVLWKMIEKAFKLFIDDRFPQVFQTGNHQTGFTKNKSTLDHATMLIQRLRQDQKMKVKRLTMFIDISAAYDCVDHGKMIKVLRKRVNPCLNDTMLTFLNIMTKAYDQQTMTIMDHTCKLTQGLTQGSALAPDLFKIYIEDMLEKDYIAWRKATNYQKMIYKWEQNENKEIRQTDLNSLNRNLMMLYADDIVIDFRDQEELEKWDVIRQPVWKEYNMKLNQMKSVVMTPEKNKDIVTPHGTYKVVKEVKYLGITVSQMKLNEQSLYAHIKCKCQKAINATRQTLARTSRKIEQIYVRSVFQYYTTPLILTKELKVENALRIWLNLQKKLYKVPKNLGKDVIKIIMPQQEWIPMWWDMLTHLNEKQPMIHCAELLGTFKPVLKIAGISTEGAKLKLSQIENENSQVFLDMRFNYRIDQNLPTTTLCLGCKDYMHWSYNRQMARDNWMETCSTQRIICTDASTMETTQANRRFVGVGIYDFENDQDFSYSIQVKKGCNSKELTNNLGELLAIDFAVRLEIEQPTNKKEIVIFTDSQVAIQQITQWRNTLRKFKHYRPRVLKILNRESVLARIIRNIAELENMKKIIMIKKVKAHQLRKDCQTWGNHRADALAQVAVTGVIRHPEAKVIVPRIEETQPDSLCKKCTDIWNSLTRTQRHQNQKCLIQHMRELKNNNEFKKSNYYQMTIKDYIAERAITVNGHHTTVKPHYQTPYSSWLSKSAASGVNIINIQVSTFANTRIQYNYEKLENQTELSDIEETLELGQNNLIMNNIAKMWQNKQDHPEQQELLMELCQPDRTTKIPTIQMSLRQYLETQWIKNKLQTLQRESAEVIAQRNRMCRRLIRIKQIPPGKLISFLNSERIKVIDWRKLAYEGMDPWVSMKLRQRECELARMQRWWRSPVMDSMLPQYLVELPGIAEAFALAQGYDSSGPVLCTICKTRGFISKATLKHLTKCETKELIVKVETNEIKQQLKRLTQGQSQNVNTILGLLSEDYTTPTIARRLMRLYTHLMIHKPDPGTPKQIAAMVVWAQDMLDLYQHLLDSDKVTMGKWEAQRDLNTRTDFDSIHRKRLLVDTQIKINNEIEQFNQENNKRRRTEDADRHEKTFLRKMPNGELNGEIIVYDDINRNVFEAHLIMCPVAIDVNDLENNERRRTPYDIKQWPKQSISVNMLLKKLEKLHEHPSQHKRPEPLTSQQLYEALMRPDNSLLNPFTIANKKRKERHIEGWVFEETKRNATKTRRLNNVVHDIMDPRNLRTFMEEQQMWTVKIRDQMRRNTVEEIKQMEQRNDIPFGHLNSAEEDQYEMGPDRLRREIQLARELNEALDAEEEAERQAALLRQLNETQASWNAAPDDEVNPDVDLLDPLADMGPQLDLANDGHPSGSRPRER